MKKTKELLPCATTVTVTKGMPFKLASVSKNSESLSGRLPRTGIWRIKNKQSPYMWKVWTLNLSTVSETTGDKLKFNFSSFGKKYSGFERNNHKLTFEKHFLKNKLLQTISFWENELQATENILGITKKRYRLPFIVISKSILKQQIH